MTNETTQAEDNDPTNTGSSSTAPLPDGSAGTSSGSGTKDPTGVEGANPALDDTGGLKAKETGESPEAPDNHGDLDLTPQGLSKEPAKQEDQDRRATPDNS